MHDQLKVWKHQMIKSKHCLFLLQLEWWKHELNIISKFIQEGFVYLIIRADNYALQQLLHLVEMIGTTDTSAWSMCGSSSNV